MEGRERERNPNRSASTATHLSLSYSEGSSVIKRNGTYWGWFVADYRDRVPIYSITTFRKSRTVEFSQILSRRTTTSTKHVFSSMVYQFRLQLSSTVTRYEMFPMDYMLSCWSAT